VSCLHPELTADGRCRDCGVEIANWVIDAADLLGEGDPGGTDMLVEDLVVDRALIAAVGRWKTTKSNGILDISISVATGLPAFGTFAIPEPGRVVFVNEESGRRALWRRLDALVRGRAIQPELLRGRLFLAPNTGVKLDESWQERLIDLGTFRHDAGVPASDAGGSRRRAAAAAVRLAAAMAAALLPNVTDRSVGAMDTGTSGATLEGRPTHR